ncbi:MAG: COG3014 family protein [Nitrospirota bacterium]
MASPSTAGRGLRAARSLPALGLLAGLLAGCAPAAQHYVGVEARIAQARFADADHLIEEQAPHYGRRNQVLYALDRGMTLHYAGRYEESNTFLEQAERLIEDLFTKSVTAETSAMLSNDYTLPYQGEDFETVMINVVAALNYALLSQWDDALVEARKVDHKLNVINDRYAKKNVYREDAFARYLSGILYEGRGELNDAFIAYRKAYDTYRVYQQNYGTPLPPTLPGDLLRVTEALGLTEEHAQYRAAFPEATWTKQKDLRSQAEVIVVSFDGLAPIKVNEFVDAPIPDGSGGVYILRIAFPKFVPRPTGLLGADVRVTNEAGGVGEQRTFLVEDITAIAEKDLADRIGRISAKAIARATAKYAAARAAEHGAKQSQGEGTGAIVGLLGNIYSLATEQADTRSWRTLPGAIRMARVWVPPGRYTITISSDGAASASREVTLEAGRKTFIAQRVVGTVAGH